MSAAVAGQAVPRHAAERASAELEESFELQKHKSVKGRDLELWLA